MRLCLMLLGKTRRPELRALFEGYIRRIGRSCPVEVREVRDGQAAIRLSLIHISEPTRPY